MMCLLDLHFREANEKCSYSGWIADIRKRRLMLGFLSLTPREEDSSCVLPQYSVELIRRLVRIQISMQIAADHQTRRAVADAKTRISKQSKAIVFGRLAELDPEPFRDTSEQAFVTHHPATDAVTDQYHVPTHRLPEDVVVKRRHRIQLIG
jgi:hypothetical protein